MSKCDEYCCNHGCNQGRDCPARVTNIKARMPAAEPLPPTQWRRYLGEVAGYILIAIVAATAGTIIVVLT